MLNIENLIKEIKMSENEFKKKMKEIQSEMIGEFILNVDKRKKQLEKLGL